MSKINSPYYSLDVTDQLSHSYKTGKDILNTLVFLFLDNKEEEKKFWTQMVAGIPRVYCLNFSVKATLIR
jgi:hypothetical protein